MLTGRWKEETDAEKQSEDEQKKEKKWLSRWYSHSRKPEPKHPMRVMVC